MKCLNCDSNFDNVVRCSSCGTIFRKTKFIKSLDNSKLSSYYKFKYFMLFSPMIYTCLVFIVNIFYLIELLYTKESRPEINLFYVFSPTIGVGIYSSLLTYILVNASVSKCATLKLGGKKNDI